MKLPQIVRELTDLAQQLGLQVRVEKGRFQGGRCTVSGDDLIVLNKRHPPERHLAILAESLRDQEVDRIFLKPTVRRALEEAWEREARTPEDPADAVSSQAA